MNTRRMSSRRAAAQRGQAFLIIVVLIALFLLGVLGLATDYTQIWAHRQMVQGAADAACQAGAGDIYINYTNPGALSNPWLGSTFNCSTNTTSSPCVYASRNGYAGSNVSVTFPSSLPGVPPLPTGFGTVADPYIKVTVTEPIPMSFTKILGGSSTVNIRASAACGLAEITIPIPLIVLHPTNPGSLTKFGSGTITILGGPQRSIQVDSSSSNALSVSGGADQIDLTQAGPNSNGSDIGVFGQEAQPTQVSLGTGKWRSPALPFGDPWATIAAPSAPGTVGKTIPQPFGWDGCPDPNGCVEFTAGNYTTCSMASNLVPGDDGGTTPGCLVLPFAGSNPRFRNSVYGLRTDNTPYAINKRVMPSGGPSCGGNNCVFQVVAAGSTAAAAPAWNATVGSITTESNGFKWLNIGGVTRSPATAIFAPGVYYVGANGFQLTSGSTARIAAPPSTTTNAWRGDAATANGDGNGGVMLYFSTNATLAVDSNSGKSSACTSASSGSSSPNGCIVSYTVSGAESTAATGNVPSRALQCPGGTANPSAVPATLNGNIMLGPCTGTYGSADGSVRGFLFFQSHTTTAAADWSGGGQFLLAGFMYFHNTSSYGDTMTLQGSSGSTAFTLGNIVTDQIQLGGGGSINMILNPDATFPILHPTLLQ